MQCIIRNAVLILELADKYLRKCKNGCKNSEVCQRKTTKSDTDRSFFENNELFRGK
jgi:hypothetical protein